MVGKDEKQRYYTSDERRKKHGERKRLGALKKEMDKDSRRRKVLKLEDDVNILNYSQIFGRWTYTILSAFLLFLLVGMQISKQKAGSVHRMSENLSEPEHTFSEPVQ